MEPNITLAIAFFAGLASFISPCVFALVPAYVGYLSGRSAAAASGEGDGKANSWNTFTHGFAFVLGFSAIFIPLGGVAGALGNVLSAIRPILVKIGGLVVILFGLHMTRIIRIPFLDYDLRPQSQPDRNQGYISSFLMGFFFAFGWAPCVGPVLGAIMTLSFNQGGVGQGLVLLTAYSAGLAIPFLIAATQIGWVTTVLRKYGKVMHYAEIVMGVVLIAIGLLLFLDRFQVLSNLGSFIDSIDEVTVGLLLGSGFLASIILGLIPAFIAKSKGSIFLDWWFLGMGISFILLIVVYALGGFSWLIPIFEGVAA